MTVVLGGPQEAFDTIDTILCSNQCSSQTLKAMIFPVRNKFSQTIIGESFSMGVVWLQTTSPAFPAVVDGTATHNRDP